MQTAKVCNNKVEILDLALDVAPSTGLVAEFGVWQGATLRQIVARRPGAHGFDSFEGLPEAWREHHEAGKFSLGEMQIPGAVLHKGWFEDTVPSWCTAMRGLSPSPISERRLVQLD